MQTVEVSPIVALLGATKCWLIANKMKQPSDAEGIPLTGWNGDDALKTFAQAKAMLKPATPYLGVRMNRVGNLVAVDLDDCLNAGQGVIDAVALWMLMKFDPYVEITPSGSGLRAYMLLAGDHDKVHMKRPHSRTMGVFNVKTCEVDQVKFTFTREIYYRAPRFAVHTGNAYTYKLDALPTMTLPTITVDDLDLMRAVIETDHTPSSDYDAKQMIDAIRADLKPAKKAEQKPIEMKAGQGDEGNSVIDAFNAATDLRKVMEFYGYTISKDGRHFTRPDKNPRDGISGYFDGDHAYTFSANDPMNETCEKRYQFKPFDLLCEFEYGGDVKAAVKALAEKMGMKLTPKPQKAGNVNVTPQKASRDYLKRVGVSR